MPKWLAIVGVLAALLGEAAAGAQMKGLSPQDIAGVARTRALDLRIAQERAMPRAQPFAGGLIVRRDLGPNATIGLGLASLYGRRKSSGDMRINGGPGRGRKPAVTFSLRF